MRLFSMTSGVESKKLRVRRGGAYMRLFSMTSGVESKKLSAQGWSLHVALLDDVWGGMESELHTQEHCF
ncbi:hypothetical protein NDU88_008638 [Pleurodeles waltl]|uniref:Uncharacterized protein n=1 Tax=Pleurodeles waltl TaxID=8319 RepID=A0AAV7NWL7_PLEWA|nr:hypothetical protein NDU88_008638 [Pleurodeles waltl]